MEKLQSSRPASNRKSSSGHQDQQVIEKLQSLIVKDCIMVHVVVVWGTNLLFFDKVTIIC
jgi:hypothetical protein